MINSLALLAYEMKLAFMKRVYPTPKVGSGQSVAEIGDTYSWECILKAAEALSLTDFGKVIQCEEKISFHNNAPNGRESVGSSWTIKEFLSAHGTSALKMRITDLEYELRNYKKQSEIKSLETLLKLPEFKKNHPTPKRNAGGNVAEIGGTYSWSCVLFAIEALNDEDFFKLKTFKQKLSFHNNQSGHNSVGQTWTIWHFLDYNGGSTNKERIKRLG